MTPRRTNLEPEPAAIVRRAPFSSNPQVGARGQRTQQRILDAALQVFGEDGYRLCNINRIAKSAGCSRVSFYQYFSSKEEVFRQLAVQVGRQLDASFDILGPLTPDANGWASLRKWVERYGEIYERYEPVFHVSQAAAESDELLAREYLRAGERYVARFGSRLTTSEFPPRELDPLIQLLMECLRRGLDIVGLLRSASPDAFPQERVEDAITDVMHRTLFGLQRDVNAHESSGERPPRLPFGPIMQTALAQDADPADGDGTPRSAYTALVDAGRAVFVTRGYHRTRVDDIAEAAGISHGAFYRYFKNKDALAHLLAAQAMRTMSTALVDVPDLSAPSPAGRAAVRRWLQRYGRMHTSEAGMIRVWVDAALEDNGLTADSAGVMDWGRRRMVRILAPRGFGDADMDAIVMVALLEAVGAHEQSPSVLDAAVHVVERGLLGR